MDDIDQRIVDHLSNKPAGECAHWLAYEVGATLRHTLDALERLTAARRVRNVGDGRPLWKVSR